jgi:ribosomal protein L11 methyltransferase
LKTYPAVIIRRADPDLVAALVDDFSPTAIEPRDDDVRVFFANGRQRDEAQHALAQTFDVAAAEVSDEDWARRSQENLQPVTVGRVTVFGGPDGPHSAQNSRSLQVPESRGPIAIVIQPSMGFGTGHHATTRLCLDALQTIDLTGRDVLDVGTGSGVLAIASVRLGAARAIGIDFDADAIRSARDNLALNPAARGVTFIELDLTRASLPHADIVTANLTGALLVRSAPLLGAAVRPGGTLVLSGLLVHERDDVRAAFGDMAIAWEREDEGWVGVAVKKT